MVGASRRIDLLRYIRPTHPGRETLLPVEGDLHGLSLPVPQGQAEAGPTDEDMANEAANGGASADDVVDADFEEVDGSKKDDAS